MSILPGMSHKGLLFSGTLPCIVPEMFKEMNMSLRYGHRKISLPFGNKMYPGDEIHEEPDKYSEVCITQWQILLQNN